MAAKLGQPFMPWQRDAAMVGCEIDPGTGLPAYREVIITVPRQSGKTTLYLTWQINRCLSPRWAQPQRSAFTAQSGKDARDKWLDELFPLIRRSRALRPLVARIYEGMGNEFIRFTNGSLIRLLSTSSSSGHSKTLHQAVLDEIWHDTDGRREQGLRPAMITIADAQLLVCSTAGTAASVVLDRKVKQGRAAVAEDSGRGIAYFEYSAPDGWDPADEESYFGFMPALCPDPPCRCGGGRWRHTVTLDAIRSERASMTEPGAFERAYGNIPDKPVTGRWLVVPREQWMPLTETSPARPDAVAFAAEVSWDRSRGMIGVCGPRPDGRMQAELAEHSDRLSPGDPDRFVREGTDWIIPRLMRLRDQWGPCAVVIDGGGPARSLLDAADEAGLDVQQPTVREVAGACGMFTDLCRDDDLRHFAQPDLDRAVAHAAKHEFGALWAWERKTPHIAPLMAVTLAMWGVSKFGPGGHYDAGQSVHFDVGELIRLCQAGVYGPADIERCWSRGLLDDTALGTLEAAGISIPAGLR